MVQQGAADMRGGKWTEAERVLKEALSLQPGHSDVQALLGMTLYHQQKYSEAIVCLDNAIQGQTQYGARSLYYLGLCYMALGENSKAEDSLVKLVVDYPNSAEARKFGTLSDDLVRDLLNRKRVPGRQILLIGDVGYNTNPSRVDGGDGDFFLSGYASYMNRLFASDFIGGVSLYTEKYFSENENDYLYLGVNVERELRIASRDSLRPAIELSQSWFDSEAYEMSVDLQLDHNRVWSDSWDTNIRLDYGMGSDLTDGESNSDSDSLGLRVRGWRQCDGTGNLDRLRLEAKWASADADTAYLGYDVIGAGIEFRFNGPDGTTIDMGLDYEQRNYGDVNPIYLVTRDDSTVELSVSTLRPVGGAKYFRVEASHAMRNSNIDDYSADETVISCGIMWIP